MSEPGGTVRAGPGTRHRSRSAVTLGACPGRHRARDIHDRAQRPVLTGGGHRVRVRAARRRRGRRHAPGVLPGRLPAPGRGRGAAGRGRGARHGPRARRHGRGRGAPAGRPGAVAGLRRRRDSCRQGSAIRSCARSRRRRRGCGRRCSTRRTRRPPGPCSASGGPRSRWRPCGSGSAVPTGPSSTWPASSSRLCQRRPRCCRSDRSPVSRRTGSNGCTASPRAAQEGRLDVAHLLGLGPDEAMVRLREIPGIGPFYSALIVIRATGFADVLPVGEPKLLTLVEQLYNLPGPVSDGELRALAEAWKPFRTWAAVLIRAAGRRVLGDEPAQSRCQAGRATAPNTEHGRHRRGSPPPCRHGAQLVARGAGCQPAARHRRPDGGQPGSGLPAIPRSRARRARTGSGRGRRGGAGQSSRSDNQQRPSRVVSGRPGFSQVWDRLSG